MNKKLLANSVAGLAALILLLQMMIATQNQALIRRATEAQQKINNGAQAQRVLYNISARVAQLSANDSELKGLMNKYGIRVNPQTSAPAPASSTPVSPASPAAAR